MVTNIFNSGNNNIAEIKTQHRLIMITITNRILKFKLLMIKIPVVADIALFMVIALTRIYSFA